MDNLTHLHTYSLRIQSIDVKYLNILSVFRIHIPMRRICIFLGLPDPHLVPLVSVMDLDLVGSKTFCLSRARFLNPVLRIRDACSGSRTLIFIHPGSKNSNKIKGWKKFVVITVATNFTKSKSIKELQNFLPKKLSLSSPKFRFGIRDPRSGSRKNLFRIPDSVSRGQKSTGSRILIRNTVYI